MTNRVPCVEKETSVDKHNHKSDEKTIQLGERKQKKGMIKKDKENGGRQILRRNWIFFLEIGE